MRRITADPAVNREMGQAARRRYEQGFSPAVGLERLVEGYRAAIAGRSGGGDSAPPAGTDTLARGGDTSREQGWGQ